MAFYKRASVITLHEPNRQMRINANSDIVAKGNVSVWVTQETQAYPAPIKEFDVLDAP